MQEFLRLNFKHIIIIFLLGSCIFLFQARSIGFEKGHLGWVASHSLALMEKANLGNGFLGFATNELTADGKEKRSYFDRYPIFFSASANLIVRTFAENLDEKIRVSRTIMNIIFFLNLIIVFFLSRELTQDQILSWCATLMTFSSSTFLFYKEMFHVDQAAVLLQGILLLFILLYIKKKISLTLLMLMAGFSVLWGRGYSNVFVRLLWFLIEFYKMFRARPISIFYLFKTTAFKGLLVSSFVSVALLSYNIFQEAKVENVPVSATSIVTSANARLGGNSQFEKHNIENISYKRTILRLINRTAYSLIPYSFKLEDPSSGSAVGILFLLMILGFIIFPVKNIKPISAGGFQGNAFYILLMGSGVLWLLIMRRLFIFHDYTIMYTMYFQLSIYIFIFHKIFYFNEDIKKYKLRIAVVCFIMFFSSLFLVQRRIDVARHETEILTYDFMQIHTAMDQIHGLRTNRIDLDGEYRSFLSGLPYALGFYMNNIWLGPARESKYVLSKNLNFDGEMLTPNNKKVFLFKKRK